MNLNMLSTFRLALLLIPLFGTQVEAGVAEGRLNVLFIAVDDLRPNISCYGVSGLKTPNMDRLAARGMLFRRAYCQIASCGPSRASVLTGRRPDTTTVFDNRRHFREALPEVVTLPQHFKDNGYHTRSIGKIFHGIFSEEINDDPASWSEPAWRPKAVQYRSEEGMRVLHQRFPKQFDDSLKPQEEVQAQRRYKGLAVEAPDVNDNDLIDGRTADEAIKVIRQVKDKPFFLAVGFVKPHAPYVAPKKYFDLYNIDDVAFLGVDKLPQGTTDLASNGSKELRGYTGIARKGEIPISQ
ncbi:MAG: sulfatase-like hydrolase/transferase, partial [Verrucomicrobia bacterium]|nr:sulfatase-like hydrolase/transferase [Verrucomicrobiota bacterium]